MKDDSFFDHLPLCIVNHTFTNMILILNLNTYSSILIIELNQNKKITI